ncbi:MAG: para-nitrobenzyl esterase PnbA, partial [Rhizobacter sp.]|nr:para-nitrobenzyl esterase PnbA [Rhizobacter sp.]
MFRAEASRMRRTSQPVVTTRAGMLAGTRLTDAGLPPIDVYKGVPYAARPVGPLRWQAPQALAPWVGVRSALQFGPDCPQPPSEPSRATRHAEDCLYLNVWAPADAACGSLPVMVWLHGGSFVGGSGSDPRSDGASLAREGVVVVTLNYRVGLFGFLAHPALSAESTRGVSGNYGLLDQLCALRWVREHIARFGGDASRITLFGNSAGASSIALLMASPLAVGLFQRAILQSPGAARPLASLAQAESAGQALGDDLDALRAMASDELLALTAQAAPLRSLRAPRLLRPIVDGVVIVEDERPA